MTKFRAAVKYLKRPGTRQWNAAPANKAVAIPRHAPFQRKKKEKKRKNNNSVQCTGIDRTLFAGRMTHALAELLIRPGIRDKSLLEKKKKKEKMSTLAQHLFGRAYIYIHIWLIDDRCLLWKEKHGEMDRGELQLKVSTSTIDQFHSL